MKVMTTLEKIQADQQKMAATLGMSECMPDIRGQVPYNTPDPRDVLLQTILDTVVRLDAFVRQALGSNISKRNRPYYDGEKQKSYHPKELDHKS